MTLMVSQNERLQLVRHCSCNDGDAMLRMLFKGRQQKPNWSRYLSGILPMQGLQSQASLAWLSIRTTFALPLT